MNDKRFTLVLFLVLLAGGVIAYGQGAAGPAPKKPRTVEDYQPRTLAEVSARASDATAPDEKIIVQGDIFPSRVTGTYAGRIRPIPKSKKDVLFRWAQLYAGAPEHYTKPYEREVLFREGKKDYWVAMRKEAVTHLEKDLKKGKRMDLYLIRLGWAGIGDEWEPLLLMENLQPPK